MEKTLSRIAATCLALTLGAIGLALAATGNVEVDLTDDQGNPIAGATVSLRQDDAAVPGAVVVTDSAGRATLTGEQGRATLVIEHDGRRKEIAVVIPPGGTLKRKVKLENPSEPPGTDGSPGPGVRVRAGAARVDTPGGNGAIGTLIVQNEIGLRFSPKLLDGTSFDVEVEPAPELQLGKRPWRLVFGLTRLEADDTSRTSVEPGTDPVALTYWSPAPTNGSTGLGLGSTGADAFVSNDFELSRFSIRLQRTTPAFIQARPYFGLRLERAEQEIMGGFTSPTFTGPSEISATIRETITDDRVSLPLGFQAAHELSGAASFHWGAHVAPGYQSTELWGAQSTICMVSACDPDELALEFELDETDSAFSFGAGVFAGFDFDLSDKVFLQVRSIYDYESRLGVSDNRQNPSEAVTHLETDDATTWRVELGVGWRFR